MNTIARITNAVLASFVALSTFGCDSGSGGSQAPDQVVCSAETCKCPDGASGSCNTDGICVCTVKETSTTTVPEKCSADTCKCPTGETGGCNDKNVCECTKTVTTEPTPCTLDTCKCPDGFAPSCESGTCICTDVMKPTPSDCAPMTNAAIVQYLFDHAFQLEASSVSATTPLFKDIPETHPNFGAIQLAATLGWIQVPMDGLFHPDASRSRADAAKMIDVAFKLNVTGAEVTLNDVDKTSWYYSYVAALFSDGLTDMSEVLPGNNFDPAGPSEDCWFKLIVDRAYEHWSERAVLLTGGGGADISTLPRTKHVDALQIGICTNESGVLMGFDVYIYTVGSEKVPIDQILSGLTIEGTTPTSTSTFTPADSGDGAKASMSWLPLSVNLPSLSCSFMTLYVDIKGDSPKASIRVALIPCNRPGYHRNVEVIANGDGVELPSNATVTGCMTINGPQINIVP